MLRALKSELIRLVRPSFLMGGIGGMAAFGAVATVVGFAAAGQSGPGPGQFIPSEAALAASDGYAAGLALAANLVGIVALSIWAIATAADYSSGLIRLLAQAEPRRWRLIVGKVLALTLLTGVGALAATVAAFATAWIGAPAFGVSTAAWADVLPTLLERSGYLAASATVWGAVGLVVALLARSAGVAISVGIGYLVVFENMIVAVASGASDWLLGSTLTALAVGGTPAMTSASAVALGTAYLANGILVAITVAHFREITD